jgi:hypothetical protein
VLLPFMPQGTSAAQRHFKADFIACGVHLVQLWQERVLQRLQYGNLCRNTLCNACPLLRSAPVHTLDSQITAWLMLD